MVLRYNAVRIIGPYDNEMTCLSIPGVSQKLLLEVAPTILSTFINGPASHAVAVAYLQFLDSNLFSIIFILSWDYAALVRPSNC